MDEMDKMNMRILTPEEREKFIREWKQLQVNLGGSAVKLIKETTGVSEATLGTNGFNEPEHYHQHELDTIKFLQGGFHPRVFTGFAIGSAIKYLQRYEEKGGREDLVKAVDFSKRLLDWYDKTHSL